MEPLIVIYQWLHLIINTIPNISIQVIYQCFPILYKLIVSKFQTTARKSYQSGLLFQVSYEWRWFLNHEIF